MSATTPKGNVAALLTLLLLLCDKVYNVRSELCTSSVCEYEMDVRQTRSMIYRVPNEGGAYNVVLEGDKLKAAANSFRPYPDDVIGSVLDPDDVLTADGYSREVITINGQFPGPTLEVLEGSEVVVKVTNNLFTMSISMHWHGLTMWGTPWMDGTGYVTQYPILPRQSFTYRFTAYPAGTHWYHSHFRPQVGDGLSGFLIIHKASPVMQSFPMAVTDWFYRNAYQTEMDNPHSRDEEDHGPGDSLDDEPLRHFSVDGIELSELRYVSALINGKGRREGELMPLSTFRVDTDVEYRFRLLNSGVEYGFEVSIDDHILQIVALDGYDIDPFLVDSVIVNPGERVDFIVYANQTEGLYWVRSQTLRAGFSNTSIPNITADGIVKEALAILIYNNLEVSDPSTSKKVCSELFPCTLFNCPFAGYNDNAWKTCIPVSQASWSYSTAENYGLDDSDYQQIMLNVGFNNDASINSRKNIPSSVPFYEEDFNEKIVPCEDAGCDVEGQGCSCTHILKLEYGKTVQIVLSNYQPSEAGEYNYMAHHPMHLHGHGFAVLAMGFPDHDPVTGMWQSPNAAITCESDFCKNPQWAGDMPELNLVNPPIKDTIIVPARGYVVLRFRTENPGPWLLHCHSESHIQEGLRMLIIEGEAQLAPPPEGYIRGGSFSWSHDEYESYLELSQDYIDGTLPPEEEGINENMCDPEADVQLTKSAFAGYLVGCVILGIVFMLLIICIYCTCAKNKGNANFT